MKFLSRVPEQLRSIGRFPVSVAVCIVLTALLNLQISGFIAMSDRFEGEVIFASAGAFLASVSNSVGITISQNHERMNHGAQRQFQLEASSVSSAVLGRVRESLLMDV